MTGLLRNRLVLAGAGAVLAGIVFGLVYLGMRGEVPARNAPAEKLRIALPLVPHAALVHIAQLKGYFAEQGLDVTIISTIHGKAAIELVVQGDADLGTASDVVFVLSATKGGGLGIAANLVRSAQDLAVVARRDHGISQPRDLQGKKVGVTLGAAGEYFLWAFFIRHMLLPASVTLVDMSPDEITLALGMGTIDAASIWQPNVQIAQKMLDSNAVTFYEPLAYHGTFNVIGRIDFLKEHPIAIERVVRALAKAELFVRTQPEESLKITADRLKIDVETLRPTWESYDFRLNLLQSQLNALEAQSQWAMTQGYLTPQAVPNYLPHLYFNALLAVAPGRVTVIH